MLTHVAADRLRRAPTPPRERTIVVGEPLFLPARLRVAQEIDAPLRQGHVDDCTPGRQIRRPCPRRGLSVAAARRLRGRAELLLCLEQLQVGGVDEHPAASPARYLSEDLRLFEPGE